MRLLILCTRWGIEHLSIEEVLNNVKLAGYDGVDTWIPESKAERVRILRLLGECDLKIVSHQHQAKGDNIKAWLVKAYL